jgi:uncharacterized membrane protein
MTLQSSKTLGGVGALLIVISPFLVSGFTLLVGLVGLILVLISVKGLSDHYNEPSIFNNSLYGVILSIVGVVVFVAALFVVAISFFTNVLGIELSTAFSDPTAFTNIDWTEAMILDNLLDHVAALVGSLVVLFVFVVVAAIFYRKSLTTLAEKTGVGLFGTAGLLLLIGAVLTIIAIGLLLIWIALILVTAAFFQIRAEPPQPPPMTPS